MSATEKDPRTVTLKGVRFSFFDGIHEKRASSRENPDKLQYGGNGIIETSGKYAKYADENRKKIMSAIRAACERQWDKPEKWKTIQEDTPKRVFFRKGDKFRNEDGEVYSGYADNYGFSFKGPDAGDRRPRLVDRRKRICIAPGDKRPAKTEREIREIDLAELRDLFYSGCYGDMTISVYGTDKGSSGIFATVDVIRTYEEGERMAGGYEFSDEDLDEMEDFDDEDDDLDDVESSSSKSRKYSDDDDEI